MPPDSELPRMSTPVPVQAATRRGRLISLGVLLLLSFLAVMRIAAPLWVGIAVGTFMAFTAQPTFRRIAHALGDRRELAAVLTTVLSGVVWTMLGALTVWVLTREVIVLVDIAQTRIGGGSLNELIGDRPTAWLDRLGVNKATLMARLQTELAAASNWIATAAGVILQTTSSAVLGFIVGLMTMYYVLIEWPRLPVRLEKILPLDPRHTRALVIEFRDVGRSALIGTVLTAVVQGTLGGVGYAICGVPHAVTWALVTALVSLIPAIGTVLVWFPVGVYLFMGGHTARAVIELVWGGLVVVGVSDYVIRPRLVGSHGHGHPLLMLIALLGGIEVFGLAGLIVGPVVMSLFVAILRIYEREVAWNASHPGVKGS
ncbi:MAG: AI-2E family transporter [Polyangiales bacterium]